MDSDSENENNIDATDTRNRFEENVIRQLNRQGELLEKLFSKFDDIKKRQDTLAIEWRSQSNVSSPVNSIMTTPPHLSDGKSRIKFNKVICN
jgi:hypothetical protein